MNICRWIHKNSNDYSGLTASEIGFEMDWEAHLNVLYLYFSFLGERGTFYTWTCFNATMYWCDCGGRSLCYKELNCRLANTLCPGLPFTCKEIVSHFLAGPAAGLMLHSPWQKPLTKSTWMRERWDGLLDRWTSSCTYLLLPRNIITALKYYNNVKNVICT